MPDESDSDVAQRLGRMINATNREMVLVTGSVARGLSDRSSDIDLYVYRPPEVDSTRSMESCLAASGARLVFGVTTATGRFEKFRHDGRYVDVEQVNLDALEAIAGRVHSAQVEPNDIKIIVGLRDALPVTDAGTLSWWNERFVLTDQVAAAEVARLGSRILSPRALYDLTWARSDELSYFARILPVMLAGLGLLGAVNREWVGVEDPKWMPWQIERLPLQPPRLMSIFRDALHSPTEQSTQAAGGVLRDILDLVDENVNDADTRAARFALHLASTPENRDLGP